MRRDVQVTSLMPTRRKPWCADTEFVVAAATVLDEDMSRRCGSSAVISNAVVLSVSGHCLDRITTGIRLSRAAADAVHWHDAFTRPFVESGAR